MPEQNITYIKPAQDSAGLGVLLKRGRKYAHIRYLFLRDGKLQGNGWTDQVELTKVIILDGHRPEVVEQYAEFQRMRQAWRSDRDTTYNRTQFEERHKADLQVTIRMNAWTVANPEPKREDFIMEVNNAHEETQSQAHGALPGTGQAGRPLHAPVEQRHPHDEPEHPDLPY
ncbi:MAG: hypothetical protein U1B30_15910 [Pseudomonadota bacterium]|nr:hypothetical protein [Pseudomonadota bacterium]